ncbi:MAG: hypothetical protein VZQ55_05295 [Ruminococcus sp.]|nr:hypothetical protein [Ruminococcus sp.]
MSKKKICVVLLILVIIGNSCVIVSADENDSVSPNAIKELMVEKRQNQYGEMQVPEEVLNSGWECQDILAPTGDIVSFEQSYSPQWENSSDSKINNNSYSYGTHDYIINTANNECDTKIPNKYKDLVIKISKRCDTEYGSKCGDNFCTALHGNGNYIANIAYLWRLARLIGTKKSQVTNQTDTKIKNFIDQMAIEAYEETTISEVESCEGTAEILWNLSEFAPAILKKYYKTTSISGSSTQSWEGRCKYIVFGMVSHMAADVFAHKVMLKPSSVSYWDDNNIIYDSSTMLDTDFFNNTDFKKADLKKDVKAGKVALFQLKKYVRDNNNSELQKLSHKNYADKASFYIKRIDESISALDFFYDTYKDVTSMNKIIDYADTCVTPMYGFSLFRYNTYTEDLNIE